LIQVENLSYRYGNTGQGLPPTSFAAEAGDHVLVDGPSASGKSTLARCLTGLIPHLYRGQLSGSVTVDGRDTRATPLAELTRHVGMVFQNPCSQMLMSTVEDEIAFGLENLGLDSEEIADRLGHILGAFDLQRLRDRIPQTLSAGEQQRVALASVLARRPRVLVLDEPLSMLDPQAARCICSLLSSEPVRETTMVAFEHREYLLREHLSLHTVTLAESPTATRPVVPAIPRLNGDDFVLLVEDAHCSLDGRPVLKGVSFRLRAGEVLGIVGPNGAGKTTLLRLLMGVQEFNGSVSVTNADAPGLQMTPQDPNAQIFNATIEDEILYGVSSHDSSFYEWLVHALELADDRYRSPLLMSEGQKKRIALAASLVRPPAHALLLDEPTIGQDERHRTLLGTLIQQLSGAGLGIIIATHDLEFLVRYIPRTVFLDAGHVVADGPTHEVLSDEETCVRHGIPVPGYVKSLLEDEAVSSERQSAQSEH